MKRCEDPSRLRYTIRRMQDHIEKQEDLIRKLQAENRLRDAETCRWTNAAREALEAIGEGENIRDALELSHFVTIDFVALLCEVVKEGFRSGWDCVTGTHVKEEAPA